MHEDPTRMMRTDDGEPPHRPHGNIRLVIAGLIAVIVGLVIAIIVIAGERRRHHDRDRHHLRNDR